MKTSKTSLTGLMTITAIVAISGFAMPIHAAHPDRLVPRRTSVATIRAAASVAGTKYDVSAALNAYSTSVYGRTFVYTSSRRAAAAGIASLTFPPNDTGLLTAAVASAGVAAQGTINNGRQLVLAAVGVAVTNDAVADIAAGSLGEIALTGFTAPTDQASALALVTDVAPAISGWQLKSSTINRYIFTVAGSRTFNTRQGPVTVPTQGRATVVILSNGTANVFILTGVGKSVSGISI